MSSRSRPASSLFALAFLLLLTRRAEAFGPPTHSEPSLNTPPSALEAIRVDEKLGEPLPLDTELIDESGQRVTLRQMLSPDRPTVLSLAYFRCPQLCSLVLKGLVKSLSETQLELGKDYHSITLSIERMRIGRIEALWRGRAGAEGPRRAADGCRPSCAPGRWRGPAASLGMPAQAALP